jgi:DNA polymerase-3 subunit delta'
LAHHHTDFVVVEAEGKGNIIRVEQAEEIGLRSQHAPFESKAHVIVFDPADRLHESAANKLLKAIEEPREGVYYVLLTTNEREIIPTILSRCMVLQVDRLDEDSARTVVDRELQSRELEVGADRVRVAVQLSQGCPGVALELITDESLDAARELTAAAIDAAIEGPPAIFGGSKSPLWLAWDEAVKSIKEEEPEDDADAVIVVKGKGKRRKRKAKKSSGRSDVTPAKQRAAAGRLAELWLLHVREQLRGAKGLEGLPKLTGLGSAKLARQVERVQAFQESLLRNPNVRLALEQTLLELSA